MNESLNIGFDEALNSPNGLFFWQEDNNGTQSEVHFSENVLKVTGYNGNEIKQLERGWESLIIKDDLTYYRKNLDKFQSDVNKSDLKLEYRVMRSNGEIIRVSERINATRSSEGNILKKSGIVIDLTEYSTEI
jgi:hypothetical protein